MLLGRAPERARLDALLDDARAARGRALVVLGEAGVGKSALLEYAVSRAEGFRVLHALGIESEADLPFSGLQQLLRPVLDLVDGLPGAQADALNRALALTEPGGADRFLVYAATLNLLASAAEDAPLLCVVDDAHWLDAGSGEALAFTARRMEGDAAVLLFAVREGEGPGFEVGGLEKLELGGLEPEDATELLRTQPEHHVTPTVASRLIAATRGNPLALIEIPAILSDGQRAGHEPLGEPLPAGASVERAFLARARSLSAKGRRALLVAAASDATDFDTIMRAVGDKGGLDDAERAGLVRVRGGMLEFRHPLVRSAVYSSATTRERREAHAALAQVLSHSDERRAWHLAAAALGPDEEVAVALEESAERAGLRGGVGSQARLFARSAGLTPDENRRVPRLLQAGRAAHEAGASGEAAALLDQGLRLVDDPLLRADLHEARLYVARAQGDVASRYETCIEEAAKVENLDPIRAANLLYHAQYILSEKFDNERSREVVESVKRLVEGGGGGAALPMLSALCWQAMYDGRPDDARRVARRGLTIELARERPSEKAADFAECLVFAEEYEEARRLLDRAIDAFRNHGALVDLVRALDARVSLELRLGRFPQAAVAGHEAVSLTQELGLSYWAAWSLARLAWVEAVQGRIEDCRSHARRSIERAQAVEDKETEAHALDALGRLELGLGEIDAAIAAHEQVRNEEPATAHPGMLLWPADLIEAYVRAGRRDDADAELKRLERRIAETESAWGVAAAARCRALLAPEPFDAVFEDALARCADVPSAFESARTELLFGERLRRAGQRVEARSRLRAALSRFDRLGAASWSERAGEELRATGERLRRRDPAAAEELTPQELQIALLAREGEKNREIAARLFLSPKTVELHLGRVYRKLGIRSRTELAHALPGD